MSVNGSIDPDKLGELFVDFCLKIINLYGFITVVYCDSAEQTLIAGMRTAVRKAGLGWIRIENALKTTINDRIRFMQRDVYKRQALAMAGFRRSSTWP